MSLSVSAAARGAGIDRGTWTSVESGSRATEEYNFARIERVLGWGAGSVRSILAGGEPTLIAGTTQRKVDTAAARAEAVADEIKDVLDDPDLSDDEKHELAMILMDAWERDERESRRRRIAQMNTLVDTFKRGRSA